MTDPTTTPEDYTYHHGMLDRDFHYRVVRANGRGIVIELTDAPPDVEPRRFLTYRQAQAQGIHV